MGGKHECTKGPHLDLVWPMAYAEAPEAQGDSPVRFLGGTVMWENLACAHEGRNHAGLNKE